MVFNKWKPYMAPGISLHPVELAGRGKRINEPLYITIDDAVEDVFQQIAGQLNGMPYALFGHSMGSAIAYRLAQKLNVLGYPPPLHLFFSGRGAPHVKKRNEKKFHLMDDTSFKREVIELGGTPAEVFDYQQLLDIYMPMLRNDFRIVEMEAWNEYITPLEASISVFLGKEERLSPEECTGWKEHTKHSCAIHYFNGGHFFLQHHTREIVSCINHTIHDLFYANQ
jgi:surfactin synthase thioesterase subunit